jgi:Uma2 family endonuclease
VSTALPLSSFTLAPAVPVEPIWRISVERYHDMIAKGTLTDEDPVELLEGWLVYKMPRNAEHIHATETLRDLLPGLIGPNYCMNSQEPITLADSEPEPDGAILRGTRADFRRRKPTLSDVALVIEVADTTLRRDRSTKKRIYARAAIPVYWIVNLPDRQFEIYSDPEHQSPPAGEPDYRCTVIIGINDLVPIVLDGTHVAQLPVAAVLG